MAEYIRRPHKYSARGLSLRFPPDLLPEGLYPVLTNVQPRKLGGIEPRGGITEFNGLTYAAAIHSLRRLNDSTDASFAVFVGAGASLYDQTSITAIDTGYDGTPLSLVTAQPRSTPKPWMYVSDAARSRKVNTARVDYEHGIAPSDTEPVVSLGTPVFRFLSQFSVPGDWTQGGTAGAVSGFTRFNGTIAAILYDNLASSNIGWCSIVPTTIDANYQAGADITVGGTESGKIREVFEPVTDTTITGILYDSGTTGACSIVLAEQSTGLRFNAIVLLDPGGANEEYVRVTSVAFGPDQQASFRCVTANAHLAGTAVEGAASFRIFLNATFAAAATLTGAGIQSSITVGTGTLDAAIVTDLANINGHPTSKDDYVHVSLRIANPGLLTEGRLVLDIDPSINDFQHNALYITFRASDIQSNVASTETALEAGATGIQRYTVDATAFDLIDKTKLDRTAASVGLSTPEFLLALSQGRVETRDQTIRFTVTDSSGQVTTQNTLPTDQQLEHYGINTNPDRFPVSVQTVPGTVQWSELFFKVSDFTRIGSDPSISLRDVRAVRIQLEVTGTTAVVCDSMWIGGTYGPDNPLSAGYLYAQRYRSQSTGALSNPAPLARASIIAQREEVLVFPVSTADPQVDLIDIFRLGGSIPAWRYVGSVENNSGVTFIDQQSDSDIAINEELSFTNYQPFPISDLPRSGVCNVVGTSVVWVSGDAFNTAWATGSEVIIDGIPYSLFAPPSSATRLQLSTNAGVANAVDFFLPDATIPATPMPAMWGPDPLTGVLFACGDGTGNIYWSNPSDPDSSSDANVYPVATPSEPMQNGFMWNGQPYVFSTDRLYRIIITNSGPGVQYTAQEIPSSQGLFGRYAFCVGPMVWWVSKHGVMEYDGGGIRCITDDSLYPLFPHDGQPGTGVYSYGAFDMTDPNSLRLFYTQDSLYLTVVSDAPPAGPCPDPTPLTGVRTYSLVVA